MVEPCTRHNIIHVCVCANTKYQWLLTSYENFVVASLARFQGSNQ